MGDTKPLPWHLTTLVAAYDRVLFFFPFLFRSAPDVSYTVPSALGETGNELKSSEVKIMITYGTYSFTNKC